jgi:HAD superfamily hydrolase (TIGR01549 family)
MIPSGSVRGVSFYYGYVLGALDLDELARRIGATATAPMEAAMEEAGRAHERAIAGGKGHEGAWRAFVGRLVVASGTNVDLAATVEELWHAQPHRNLWRRVPAEARALLAELAGAGVPIVVTTNSEGRSRELMEELGLLPHLRGVVDSGVVGVSKPDRRLFELSAERLGVALSEMVHVGDSEEADVAGAIGAGAWAIRFDGLFPGAVAHATKAHARARNYLELRDILKGALDQRWP